MASSGVKTPKTPKQYITFKVITEITLSEADVQEICQNEKRLTKEQLRCIFQSLKDDTVKNEPLEVEGSEDKEPRDSVKERILDELDYLDTDVKCYECGKNTDTDYDVGGLWDRCSGGDTYKCYSCCNPPEEEADEAEGSS